MFSVVIAIIIINLAHTLTATAFIGLLVGTSMLLALPLLLLLFIPSLVGTLIVGAIICVRPDIIEGMASKTQEFINYSAGNPVHNSDQILIN